MENRLIRRKEVGHITGLSRSAIYDRLDAKSPRYDSTFPRPISLGTMSVAWVASEIQVWIASLVERSRASNKAEVTRKETIARRMPK